MIFPEINNLATTTIVILTIFALCNVIIIYSRIPGVNAMKKCFPQMLPAQEFLLPSNTYLDSLTKQRYYKFFSEKLESFSVLKSDKEMIPMAATAVTWLIAQTRDEKKFPLINEENINFGFSYNLLGLKKCGIFLTLIGLAVNIIFYVLQMNFHLDLGVKLNALIASTIINFLFLLLWIVIVSKKLVKNCAKKYARALLSACDSPHLNS